MWYLTLHSKSFSFCLPVFTLSVSATLPGHVSLSISVIVRECTVFRPFKNNNPFWSGQLDSSVFSLSHSHFSDDLFIYHSGLQFILNLVLLLRGHSSLACKEANLPSFGIHYADQNRDEFLSFTFLSCQLLLLEKGVSSENSSSFFSPLEASDASEHSEYADFCRVDDI